MFVILLSTFIGAAIGWIIPAFYLWLGAVLGLIVGVCISLTSRGKGGAIDAVWDGFDQD